MHAIGMLFPVIRKESRRMPDHFLSRLFLLAMWLVPFCHAHAQEADKQPPLTRMLFVFDASNSMNAFWGNKPRLDVARELMLRSLTDLEGQPDLELALRVYGNRSPIAPGKQDCDDTHLEVPFGPGNSNEMRSIIKGIRAVGTTPIARSLERAAKDFPEPDRGRNARSVRNIIILITDGIEACDEDPCAVSRALQAKGIVLKPFVIGVGLDDEAKFSLQCVGNYFDAATPEMFDHVLKVVITQALNTTTAQVSLLTDDGKPTETDVAVSLYDQKTGLLMHHFVHTMNDRGRPDTLRIDPVHTYRVVVHTVPPAVREQVTLKPGVHNIITVDAGTGFLELRAGTGPPDAWPVQCIVRRKDGTTTLNVQEMNSSLRYRTGLYDLEVLTLPRTMIPDVRIDQGRSTAVQVPQAGVLNVQAPSAGHGAVFLKDGSELIWVVDLDPTSPRNQFRLQPGTYQVLYRSRNARQTEFSTTRDVTVTSGRSVNITF